MQISAASLDSSAMPLGQPTALDADWLRSLALEAGADDVGFVPIEDKALDEDRRELAVVLPGARACIAFVRRMNRAPIRSPARSIANLEFHHTTDRIDAVAAVLVAALERRGVAALNPSAGFPMEMDSFPGKTWVVSHKRVAEAAGLGRMGIHRNLIHPRFGSFVLLGTVIVAAPISRYSRAIEFNPCVTCKLCVAACPVGAIAPDGRFDFSACYTHNYREFMGGFGDWVETIAESDGAKDYRRRVRDSETASMWQSLSFGANYKAAYCMAVCPAGDDVIAPFRNDRREHLQQVVKPLQEKGEPVYVVAGSDAEAHVAKRFPHKTARRVKTRLRPRSIAAFVRGLSLTFQASRAQSVDARYHFHFDGDEAAEATVAIRHGRLEVLAGIVGEADTRVEADARTWLAVLNGERSLFAAVLRRRVRVRGSVRRLIEFRRCFLG